MSQQDDRLDMIFRCIVETYVETAIPVGSRAISKRRDVHLSPASIRNVMADLEEMGFIRQPHTSAGRMPTERGYRYYVNRFMSQEGAEESEVAGMEDVLREAHDVEDLAEKVSHLLAELTQNAGICFLKNIRRLAYFPDAPVSPEVMAEDAGRQMCRLYVEGASLVFEHPEFSDIQKAQGLLRAFESKRHLADFFEQDPDDGQTHIYIGEEVPCDDLSDVSVVVRKYHRRGNPMGCLGVIGPTRMNYNRAVNVVNGLAETVSDYLGGI